LETNSTPAAGTAASIAALISSTVFNLVPQSLFPLFYRIVIGTGHTPLLEVGSRSCSPCSGTGNSP
jgi:hypothetical protein